MTYEEAVSKLTDEAYASDIEEISRVRMFLGGQYAYLNSLLTDILIKKPDLWNEIRHGGSVKSDTATDRAWEATELGKEETMLKRKLKSIEIMMTSTNSRIMVLKGESHSQW